MEPEKEDIEIKAVEESEGGLFSARAGGEASVTIRLLTQEEFDRLEAEKQWKVTQEGEGLRDPLRDR